MYAFENHALITVISADLREQISHVIYWEAHVVALNALACQGTLLSPTLGAARDSLGCKIDACIAVQLAAFADANALTYSEINILLKHYISNKRAADSNFQLNPMLKLAQEYAERFATTSNSDVAQQIRK